MPRWPTDRPTYHETFWLKVDKAGPIPEERPDLGACWLWTGCRKKRSGYGSVKIGGRTFHAHRVAYELVLGPIPEGLEIDHLCRVTACVNPAHLEAVTHTVNVMRGRGFGAKNAAKTHCPRGHPLSGANLYRFPSGGRTCRTCRGY